jgi:hypothetical protein
MDPSVGLAFSPSYGLPSGHAQLAVCFWLPLAFRLVGRVRRKAPIVLGVCFILLISFSRVYLGLHFPTDILGGWLLGGLCIIGFYKLDNPITGILQKGALRAQLLCAALLALLMNALFPANRMLSALFLGFSIGYSLMETHFPFRAALNGSGTRPRLINPALRLLIGFGGAIIFHVIFDMVLPGKKSLFGNLPFWGPPSYELGHFVHYTLLGLWMSGGAVWVFAKLRLGESKKACE